MTAPGIVDVAVVGGGIVGSVLANLIAQRLIRATGYLPISIAVLDPAIKCSQAPIPEVPLLRTSALSARSREILQEANVWDGIPSQRIKPFLDMRVSAAPPIPPIRGSVAFRPQTPALSPDPLGFMVENDLIVQSCANSLYSLKENHVSKGKIHIIHGSLSEVDGLNSHGKSVLSCWPRLKVKNNLGHAQEIQARLIVGAEGGRSKVRDYAGIGCIGRDYQQKGVVACVRLENETDIAWQRFLPTGPLAILPSFEKYASIVWSTSNAHAAKLLQMSNQEFIDNVNFAFNAKESDFRKSSPRLPKQMQDYQEIFSILFPKATPAEPPKGVEVVSKRATFPLHSQSADTYVRPRIALVGDAAHMVHPLAGQGVNLGIKDADMLAKVLVDAILMGADCGDLIVLEEYEKNARRNTEFLATGIHALQQLFTSQNSLAILARNFGLDIVDSLPFLKERFVKMASGKHI